jgi:rubrerythrin
MSKEKEVLERLASDRKLFNDQFDALMSKLNEETYKGRGYSKTSNVTIPGTLFAEFLNTVTQVKSVLENVSKAAEVISRSSDVLQNETAKMTIRLMQAHVNNIDSGWSSTNAQLDAEDAEELIVETKE